MYAALFVAVPSCGLHARRAQLVQCSKGFGSDASTPKPKKGSGNKKQSPSVNRGDAKAVERAVKLVEDRKARPVDSREAARGKVEFVKVKDWGTGEPADLGQLQVAASSQVQLSADAPFYEQLAKRLELLEAQGALPVAQIKGAKPLPPFTRWAFAEAHYLQYLCDLLSVHSALEQALSRCVASSSAAGPQTLVPGHLLEALQLVGPDQGIARSQQLLADIQRINGDSSSQGSAAGSSAAMAAQADGSSTPLPPSPNAVGLAQLLGALASRVCAAETQEEAASAVVKLLAHTYVLLLVLLTSGGRIGAAAAEKLNLFARGALNTYRTYPPQVKDPIELLKSVINRWGELLLEQEKEGLLEELPGAMQKASLLLTPLARE